ncbi:complement C1q tumor necrosis factor-related protein 2-like [Saccostrea echinata]|uniref:complement C1q tumor necrosis factor-related protein 2-like n=1 Tax=Saccostrea echinata TaxID=191078 RepID=UPI002A814A8B|nr:complement C1q tumor necrosis factor-related protein 2-like [Saccostrea echinata]
MFLYYLPLLFAIASTDEVTTLPKDWNLTSLEERLTKLEQTTERRLNTTEKVLGQLLTGRSDTELSSIDVLAIRSGILIKQSDPVLFSAYKYSTTNDISSQAIIRFEKTYINIGGHYHTEDGIFIAPTTGIYMFHWTIVTGGSDFHTQLIVGGTARASSYVPFPGGSDSSSAMVIISVNKDDHVWIQIYGSIEHVYGGWIGVGSYKQSTFTGILIKTK